MASKKSTFETILSEINQRRGKVGGILPWADLQKILAEYGIKKSDWYRALAHAKETTPNLHELFYKAFGREPPNRQTWAKREKKPKAEKIAKAAKVEEAPAEEPAPTHSVSEALAQIIGWLDIVGTEDRWRIISTVDAYYSFGGAKRA